MIFCHVFLLSLLLLEPLSLGRHPKSSGAMSVIGKCQNYVSAHHVNEDDWQLYADNFPIKH